jgi:Putative peptidoglycan binding domain
MNGLRLLCTLLLVAAFSFAVTPTAKKKSASKTASKKSTSKKKSAKKTVPGWRSTQKTPTPDRYKEIQQALAGKGYATAPSGVWDSSSVAALKKFQEDQSLEPSGKIDSLSLIALGLGPRRDRPPAPQP